MLQFACDYCGNIKGVNETWINGLAVENVGTRAARREVVIDPSWRYERVVQPLAVHFCCVECKDRYLEELFQQPVPLIEVEAVEVNPIAGRRVIVAKRKPAAGTTQKRTTKKARRR
ncbi:MAG: hypothetical protein WBM04_20035 [Candidatus Korobacteraceae bacterium]